MANKPQKAVGLDRVSIDTGKLSKQAPIGGHTQAKESGLTT
jgi:hypothetical protein